MLPPSTKFLIAFVASLACAAAPAQAMVVAHRDFPELVARAEQIVIGTVSDIHEEQDDAGVPSTLVTFSDLTVLKGNVDATLTLHLYGGTAGDVAVHISDMPSFAVGERAVLFVAGNGRSLCPLVGVWQGRFRVRRDASGGGDVIEDSSGSLVTGLTGRELRRRARHASAGPAPLTVDGFRQLIADELASPRAADAPH